MNLLLAATVDQSNINIYCNYKNVLKKLKAYVLVPHRHWKPCTMHFSLSSFTIESARSMILNITGRRSVPKAFS